MTQDQALIVVDVQNDFADQTGSLYVPGGDSIASLINLHLKDMRYSLKVATKDWHPVDGTFAHFSANPDFVETFPPHCVQFTRGAAFHRFLHAADHFSSEEIFFKGQVGPAFSGFEGVSLDGESLEDFLFGRLVRKVKVMGLAADFCVKATAKDAVKLGFHTTVITNLTAAVRPQDDSWRDELRDAGVHLSEMAA